MHWINGGLVEFQFAVHQRSANMKNDYITPDERLIYSRMNVQKSDKYFKIFLIFGMLYVIASMLRSAV